MIIRIMAFGEKKIFHIDTGLDSALKGPKRNRESWLAAAQDQTLITGEDARKAAAEMSLGISDDLITKAFHRQNQEVQAHLVDITYETNIPLAAEDIEIALNPENVLLVDNHRLKRNIMALVDDRIIISDDERLSNNELINNLVHIVRLANEMCKPNNNAVPGEMSISRDELEDLKNHLRSLIIENYGATEVQDLNLSSASSTLLAQEPMLEAGGRMSGLARNSLYDLIPNVGTVNLALNNVGQDAARLQELFKTSDLSNFVFVVLDAICQDSKFNMEDLNVYAVRGSLERGDKYKALLDDREFRTKLLDLLASDKITSLQQVRADAQLSQMFVRHGMNRDYDQLRSLLELCPRLVRLYVTDYQLEGGSYRSMEGLRNLMTKYRDLLLGVS